MRIGVFAYNFKHWKTQTGVQNLILAGYKPSVIFAADPVELNFYTSKIRTKPKDLFLFHPREIAEKYGIDYHVVAHNSEDTGELVKKYELDVGVILGARILKPVAFKDFNIGVLNMHPGILPENRGLDTLKWAVIDKMQQGVTTHLIDSKIDRGSLLERNKIKVYKDDTLMDLQIRIQNLEQEMMISSLKILEETPKESLQLLGEGSYHRAVPPEIEATLWERFKEYKKEFVEP